MELSWGHCDQASEASEPDFLDSAWLVTCPVSVVRYLILTDPQIVPAWAWRPPRRLAAPGKARRGRPWVSEHGLPPWASDIRRPPVRLPPVCPPELAPAWPQAEEA